MLWPRPRSLSAPCPPCVRLVSALRPPWVRFGRASKVCPPCVRHVSASCPPCVRLGSALAASLNFVRHASAMSRSVSALSPPCAARPKLVCHPLKPWPCLWTLPARGLLWGRAMASSGKILSHHCATHHVYIACPLVSFLDIFILAHQIRPSLAHPMLEKLFWVYAGILLFI